MSMTRLLVIRGKRARERGLYRLTKRTEAVGNGDLALILHDEVAQQPFVVYRSVALPDLLEAVDVDLGLAVTADGEDAAGELRDTALLGDDLETLTLGLVLVRAPSGDMPRFAALEACTLFNG